MKKYVIAILCFDNNISDCCVDYVNKLFDTKQDAENEMNKCLEEEWLSLISPLKPEELDFEKEETYYIHNNCIKYGTFIMSNGILYPNDYFYQVISEYNILEIDC